MSSPEILLELTAITLIRGRRHLLQDIDLQLARGEIVTLIGPNGAGKTTLLRVALGLLAPTSGEVQRKAGVRIGYMPQQLQIDPTFPLTVKRFLAMNNRAQQERMLPLLEEVGADQVLDSPLQNLSGGEMQRVLLARALLREPELLVLDEPVQGVDVHGQIDLYQLISRVREQRNCAVLMVSHDLHLVMSATDRVLCLNGHICCSGTPEAVTSNPAFIEMFGLQAIESLAIYSHDKNHRHDNCSGCKDGSHAR
ncbi:MAG: zinc ABC transporter ATP-binding protein ZnuC [Desulfuromonadales bacterium]|nr:zinc ABC transporter ATP-binding protein ZnuC [Desulfuromonadales bacterium]